MAVRSLALAAMSCAVLVVAVPVAHAQEPERLYGEWELRPQAGTSNYARMTCRIVPVPDGAGGADTSDTAVASDTPEAKRFRVIYDLVGVRGGLTHLEWTGRLDGADYAVQGLDYSMTNAYTPVDARTFRIVTKVEGRVQSTAETTVSVDGQSMTTVTRGLSGSGEEIETTVVYRRVR